MPFVIQTFLLAILGAVLGSMINWAIYAWAVIQHRPISPFMKPRPDRIWDPEDVATLARLENRTWADFIPILGWFRLKRDSAVFGKGCWIRPLLIELSWMIGLPLFFIWQHAGGLVDQATVVIPTGSTTVTAFSTLANIWFWLQTILIALMCIATFIDFDEQMIPDHVTVWGTFIALIAAAWFPESRLPLVAPRPSVEEFSLLWVNFASPNLMGSWVREPSGLLACLAIYGVWIWALLPKIVPLREFRLGIIGSLRIVFASIVRPRRKSDCPIRVRPRTMFGTTRLYLLLLVVGLAVLSGTWWSLSPFAKESLVSAFIGLAVAGGLIWAIRIVGGLVLGQQAMGFGDVTLMCMIGAFLGWQAATAGFVYSIGYAFVFGHYPVHHH